MRCIPRSALLVCLLAGGPAGGVQPGEARATSTAPSAGSGSTVVRQSWHGAEIRAHESSSSNRSGHTLRTFRQHIKGGHPPWGNLWINPRWLHQGGVWRCKSPGMVALAFDDGPRFPATDSLLNVLDEEGVKATFFVSGELNLITPQKDRQLANVRTLKRMVKAGHTIANHGLQHLSMSNESMPAARLRAEINNNERLVNSYLDNSHAAMAKYYRGPFLDPPHAGIPPESFSSWGWKAVVYGNLACNEYLGWSVDRQLSFLLWGLGDPRRDSFITVCHDADSSFNMNTTMRAFIRQVKAAGWRLVTLEECLGEGAASRSSSTVDDGCVSDMYHRCGWGYAEVLKKDIYVACCDGLVCDGRVCNEVGRSNLSSDISMAELHWPQQSWIIPMFRRRARRGVISNFSRTRAIRDARNSRSHSSLRANFEKQRAKFALS